MAARFFLLALILGSAHAAEPNWPAWRGPSADGVAPAESDPPVKWDANTNIKWKAELPGRGSATPAVWGDQVFVLTAIQTDRVAKPEELPRPDPTVQQRTTPPNHFYRFEVMSFDLTTGKLRWKKTANEAVPHEGHHVTHSYAAGSPTTDGKRLYVSFGSFGVYAYSLDGELLWKRDFGRLQTRLGWGEAVTPVVHGDNVILNLDQEKNSKLVVLDAATGKTKWEAARDEKSSWNTPFVAEHDGVTQVIVNGTGRARAYNLADGKVIWEAGGMTTNAIPSPVAKDGVAFVMSGYKGAAALAVPLGSKGDLTDAKQFAWRYDRGTPYVPSPLLYQGRLYFTSGNTQLLTVLDTKTGKVLSDGERLPGVTQFYASPVAAAGRIYFVDRQGTTAVMKAGDAPEQLAVNKLGDAIDASPVVVGKMLILRGEMYLWAIEAK